MIYALYFRLRRARNVGLNSNVSSINKYLNVICAAAFI